MPPITRPSDGWVALKYMQNRQHLVEIPKTKPKRGYVFVPRRNVFLAWVHPDDVAFILAIKETCCGGKPKPNVYRYANEQDLKLYDPNYAG